MSLYPVGLTGGASEQLKGSTQRIHDMDQNDPSWQGLRSEIEAEMAAVRIDLAALRATMETRRSQARPSGWVWGANGEGPLPPDGANESGPFLPIHEDAETIAARNAAMKEVFQELEKDGVFDKVTLLPNDRYIKRYH